MRRNRLIGPALLPAGPLLALVALAAATSACTKLLSATPAPVPVEVPVPDIEVGPWTSARVIESSDDLLRGPYARGKVGDLILENDLSTFVVRGVRASQGAGGEIPGAIVDAVLRESGTRDALELFSPLAGTACPYPVRLETIEVGREGGEGEKASVVAKGSDGCNPSIAMETTYELAPGSAFVLVRTTFTNEGEEATTSHRIGDELRWGGTRQWMPGHGFDPHGTLANVPWIAGLGDRIGYGWASLGRAATVESGPGWSRAVLEQATIDPGESLSFERLFIVGAGDGASLLLAAQGPIGAALGVLTCVFQEVRTSEPLSGGLLEIRDAAGRPFVTARASADGTFRVPLPAGEWVVVSREPGRVTAMAGRARLRAGGRGEALVEASAAGSAQILVVEQRRDPETPDVLHHFPIPSRLAVHGVDGTITPSFGPPYDHRGAQNFVFLRDGRAKLPLAPGRYRVIASRGIEYEIDEGVIDVMPGEEASLELRLKRSVDTRGFVSADLHQHTNLFPGSRVSRRSRVVSNAAEGIELVLVTDPGEISDLSRPFAYLDPAGDIGWLPGVAFTGPAGRFGCFPVPAPEADTNPVSAAESTSAAGIFSACRSLGPDAIVQVNTPRDDEHGYFTLAGVDPDTGSATPSLSREEPVAFDTTFDAIEVMSGVASSEQNEQAVQDWFNLLNQGHRVTGTGGSGAKCLIEDMNGYPRTYLGVEAETAGQLGQSEVAAAIRGGRVVVTNGPFPQLVARWNAAGASADQAEGDREAGIGETLRVPPGAAVRFSVVVQAPGWAAVDRLALVRDGEEALVVELEMFPTVPLRHESEHVMVFEESAWVLLRVGGSAPSSPPGLEPAEGASPPAAFTNPIWIEVAAD